MKLFLFPFLLSLSFLALVSCNDDPEGTPTGRFVFYVKGDVAGPTEFRRYDINGMRDDVQSTERVVSITNVAANGIVLYETRGGASPSATGLFGLCEGGQVLPVPLPVATDPVDEYVYGPLRGWSGIDPSPALAYDGHHAAFFAWQRPVGSVDSTEWSLHLCVFNCSEWKMSTTDISAFLRDHFTNAGSDFRPDIPIPTAVFIANDGSMAAMQLMVQHRGDHDPVGFRNLLLLQSQSGIHLVEENWSSIAFDPSPGWLLVSHAGGGGNVYDRHGGSWDLAHVPLRGGIHSLSGRSGECVVYSYGEGAFLLQRPTDGRLVKVPLDSERLKEHFPDVTWLFGSIRTEAGLSPDGEWIVFTADHADNQGLYILRRDGTGLRRIAEGVFDVPPVVSDIVPY
ncbi:MAG: hypothetical protein KFF77_10210 [Bacteroidetes bacterium]|nr:hypothetical protein [Bacteroidota bacterium]